MNWLLCTHENFSLRNVYFSSATTDEQTLDLIANSLDKSLSHLEAACFHFNKYELRVWTKTLAEHLGPIVTKCISLKTFYLHVALSPYPRSAVLPPALELLRMPCPIPGGPSCTSFDWKVSSLLSRSHLLQLRNLVWDISLEVEKDRNRNALKLNYVRLLPVYARKAVRFCAEKGAALYIDCALQRSSYLRDHLY